MHLPKPVLAMVALATVIVVGGCGGASGTPTPPPVTDPMEVLTKAVTGAPDIKTLHIKLELGGKVSMAALGGSSGGASGSIDLTGSSIEGDIDVANQAADLKITVSGILAMAGLPSEIIVKDGSMYMKSNSTGKFAKSDFGSLAKSLPVSIPSAGAAPSGLADKVATIRKQLTDAGLTVTMKPEDNVAGKAAYHVSLSYPIDQLNKMLAGMGNSMAAGIKFDNISGDIWTYKDSQMPAKLLLSVGAGTLGNVDVTVTLTNYGAPVTISAPAAADIAG